MLVKTLILPLVLYECKSWSVGFMEERRLRAIVNRLLRRMTGPERDGMANVEKTT
jgi:hypothetical protein